MKNNSAKWDPKLLFETVSCLNHQSVRQFSRDQLFNDRLVACTIFSLL